MLDFIKDDFYKHLSICFFGNIITFLLTIKHTKLICLEKNYNFSNNILKLKNSRVLILKVNSFHTNSLISFKR